MPIDTKLAWSQASNAFSNSRRATKTSRSAVTKSACDSPTTVASSRATYLHWMFSKSSDSPSLCSVVSNDRPASQYPRATPESPRRVSRSITPPSLAPLAPSPKPRAAAPPENTTLCASA